MATKKKSKKVGSDGTLHYHVTMSICGRVTVLVEATDEEEAIEKAWDKLGDEDADVEWKAHEKIVSGNVFHGSTNEIEVDLAE